MAAVRTTPLSSNESHDPSSSRRRTAAIGSIALTVIALVGGDAAMAAVVAAVRHGLDGALLQGATAGAVIAAASYALVGVPQIRLGRRQTQQHEHHEEPEHHADKQDRRTRWALDRLAARTPLAWLVASVVAGPLAIGLATGRAHDHQANRKTAAAAAVFGAVWAAVYLGLLGTFL